jgi:pyrroline-5-carboxylate reductase
MRIALIGCGNMGQAILAGQHRKHHVSVVEPRAERRRYLKRKYRCVFRDAAQAVRGADVVVLAVKPQDFPLILGELAAFDLKRPLVISIAAGITTGFIEKAFKAPVRVVRAMPNLPAVIGEGVTSLTRGRYASSRDMKTAVMVFSGLGGVVTVKESLVDAVTALSGSGPAYVFFFAECLIASAARLGLTPEQARDLAYQTLSGSARLLMKSKDTAGVLRQKVTSKGGTTQAALDVLMKRDTAGIFNAALKAARDRARALAK